MSNEFNWKQFHKDLDIALAVMITETDALPSKTTLIEFLEFSNKKQLEAQSGAGEKGRL